MKIIFSDENKCKFNENGWKSFEWCVDLNLRGNRGWQNKTGCEKVITSERNMEKVKIIQKLGQKWLRSTNLTRKRKEICEYFNEVKIAQTYPKNHLRSTHISQNTSFAIENPLNSRSALSSQRSQFFITQLQYSCFFAFHQHATKIQMVISSILIRA